MSSLVPVGSRAGHDRHSPHGSTAPKARVRVDAEAGAELEEEPQGGAPGRRYAGRSPDERRQQLLDAGLQVFGTVGYDELTRLFVAALR